MCLVDKKQFRCAESKIPVWKVVRLYKGVYYSPYQNAKIHKLNQVVNLQDEHQLCNFPGILCRNEGRYYVFDEGFYHAFLDKEFAESLAYDFNKEEEKYKFPLGKYVVISGYIPEDVRYALETTSTKCICARKMILNI